MSVGDIIRLNRMYKCGDAYLMNQQPNDKNKTKIENNNNKNINKTDNKPKSFLGILIFQSRGR